MLAAGLHFMGEPGGRLRVIAAMLIAAGTSPSLWWVDISKWSC